MTPVTFAPMAPLMVVVPLLVPELVMVPLLIMLGDETVMLFVVLALIVRFPAVVLVMLPVVIFNVPVPALLPANVRPPVPISTPPENVAPPFSTVMVRAGELVEVSVILLVKRIDLPVLPEFTVRLLPKATVPLIVGLVTFG